MKSRPKRTALYIAIGLAIFTAGFLLGRVSRPSLPIPHTVANTTKTQSSIPVSRSSDTTAHTNNTKAFSKDALYPVLKVIDGDTLSISIDGAPTTVRLIGIDTPEVVDPRKPVECFGIEASNKAKAILTNARIRIETDESQDRYDKYGRLLAYVFLSDGTNFNKLMIADGFAHEYTYNTPYKYQKEFKAAESTAQRAQKGLWASDACGGITSTSGHAQAPHAIISPLPGYTCSSNAYNCADFTTHAEAQMVYEACGGVDNDIHWLDQDKDGLACESLP